MSIATHASTSASAFATRTRYDALTQFLHWFIAALVIGTYAIGLGREAIPKGDFRTFLLGLHMSLGLALIALMVVRIAWRISAPAVPPVAMPARMQLAAKLGHIGLYALLLAVPLVGLAAAWIKGRNVGFFGLPLPSPFAVNVPTGKMLEGAHEVVANGLMALAGLHAAAAILHHHLLKDDTLRRMLPQRWQAIGVNR